MNKRPERKTSSNVKNSVYTDDAKIATVESNLVDAVSSKKVGDESYKTRPSQTSLVTSDKHSSHFFNFFSSICFRCPTSYERAQNTRLHR